jgi:hypothetical protein
MLRKVLTSLLLIFGSWAAGPDGAVAQDVSPRARAESPDAVYIVCENPNDPARFWCEVMDDYDDALKATQEINVALNRQAYFEAMDWVRWNAVDRDRWNTDPAYRMEVVNELRGRRVTRKAPPTPKPQEPIILAPSSGNGPSRGIKPPLDMRSIEQGIITDRDYGVRQVEPQVRSPRRPEERLTVEENTPPSGRPGSTATPAPRGRSQTRPAAPSTRPVRRPRPDAPTGFPSVDRRARRQDRPAAPDSRTQQKPRDARPQSKSKKSQQRRSPSPSYVPPSIWPGPSFTPPHGG